MAMKPKVKIGAKSPSGGGGAGGRKSAPSGGKAALGDKKAKKSSSSSLGKKIGKIAKDKQKTKKPMKNVVVKKKQKQKRVAGGDEPSTSQSVGFSDPSSSSSSSASPAIVPVVCPSTTSGNWSAAALEPGRPTANAHLSKSKKKSWRRVDVDDVERFLDDQRRDERTGASKVAEMSDADLFVVDKKGDLEEKPSSSAPASASSSSSSEPKKLNKRVRASLEKPIVLDPSLVFRNAAKFATQVPPALGKVNRVRTPAERRAGAAWAANAERRSLARLQKSVAARQKAAQLAEERRKSARAASAKSMGKNAVFYDLWSEPVGPVDGPMEEAREILENGSEELVKHTFIDHFKSKLPKVPEKLHRNPSALPKVELPHPGMSYNPCVDDHRELMEKAVEVELEKEAEEAKWLRQTVGMFPAKEDAPTEESRLLELAEGLFEEQEEDEDEAKEEKRRGSNADVKKEGGEPQDHKEAADKVDETEEDEAIYKAPIRAEDRKTRQKRRREHEAKVKALEAAEAKLARQKESEVFRIRQIRKELESKEKEIAERAEIKKRKLENYKKFGTKKLSKNQYVDPDIPVKFAAEISSSLRSLKPEGHLLVDRFRSLQKRNVIETRVKEKGSKRKLKRYVTRDKRKFMAQHGIDQQGSFKKLSWHR